MGYVRLIPEPHPPRCAPRALALAGIERTPETTLSRSVVIRMQRAPDSNLIEQFREKYEAPEGRAIAERPATWAASIVRQIAKDRPILPETVRNRDSDVWEPLVAIADRAGGHWPDRARVAAVALVADSGKREPSLGVHLLSDIRTVFDRDDVLPTEKLLSRLHAMEESPWGEMQGKPLSPYNLARLLKPYEIRSTTIRIGSSTPKGYRRSDLLTAWNSYLPSTSPEAATSATSATS